MELFNLDILVNLITLTGLEIILGIDNVIFIALLIQPLKGQIQKKARYIGLTFALIIRILLLFCANSIMKLTNPLISIGSFPLSGKSLLLIIGGAFLIVKGILELIELFAENSEEKKHNQATKSFFKIIIQIIFIDIVLSFDSIITAVGVSNELPVMIVAMVVAMLVMLVASGSIGNFIYQNPSTKVLALNFIIMVGVMLFLAGFDIEIDKSHLYFAILFASITEIINISLRKKRIEHK